MRFILQSVSRDDDGTLPFSSALPPAEPEVNYNLQSGHKVRLCMSAIAKVGRCVGLVLTSVHHVIILFPYIPSYISNHKFHPHIRCNIINQKKQTHPRKY